MLKLWAGILGRPINPNGLWQAGPLILAGLVKGWPIDSHGIVGPGLWACMGRPANRQQAIDGPAHLYLAGHIWAGPFWLSGPTWAGLLTASRL